MEDKLAIQQTKQADIAKRLNASVMSVMGAKTMLGFEKAFLVAKAVGELKEILTTEYMQPIMDLQDNRLGFKTDKQKDGGYALEKVKNCLIEAVLTGVQPYGNQFNIIAGNCYITKEGFGYLLSNFPGLSYEIMPGLPKVNQEKTGAAITMKIVWQLQADKQERSLEIPIKMDAYTTVDAIIGKATRKARAWLYNTITGSEVADGDVETEVRLIPEKPDVDKEEQRLIDLINSCTTVEKLKALSAKVETSSKLTDIYNYKMDSLNGR